MGVPWSSQAVTLPSCPFLEDFTFSEWWSGDRARLGLAVACLSLHFLI